MRAGVWSGVGVIVAALVTIAPTASAQVSDAVWSALKERDVVVEKQDGTSLEGKLIGVEAASIVLMQADGQTIEVDRSTIQSARVRAQGAPSESAEPPPPSPPPARKRAAIGQQVVVVTEEEGEEEEIAGKLVDMDDTSVVIQKDGGERVTVARTSIKSVRKRKPKPYPASGRDDSPSEKTPGGEPAGSSEEVPGRSGFQMSMATGYAIPLGSVDATLSQSDFVSGQWPLLFDIGWKLGTPVYMGVYGGFGLGGAGGFFSDVCALNGVSCSSLTVRFGFDLQWHIVPDGRFNPYLSVGLGFESTETSLSANTQTESLGVRGFEFPLIVGIDYRLHRLIGFGPYIIAAPGEYISISSGSQSGDLQNKAIHAWLTVGARVTLFP